METRTAIERAVVAFVDYYNHSHYQEGTGNVTPTDVYHSRRQAIVERIKEVRRRTLDQRRNHNWASRQRERHPSVLDNGRKSPKVADVVQFRVSPKDSVGGYSGNFKRASVRGITVPLPCHAVLVALRLRLITHNK
jgi:hypothetical protein